MTRHGYLFDRDETTVESPSQLDRAELERSFELLTAAHARLLEAYGESTRRTGSRHALQNRLERENFGLRNENQRLSERMDRKLELKDTIILELAEKLDALTEVSWSG